MLLYTWTCSLSVKSLDETKCVLYSQLGNFFEGCKSWLLNTRTGGCCNSKADMIFWFGNRYSRYSRLAELFYSLYCKNIITIRYFGFTDQPYSTPCSIITIVGGAGSQRYTWFSTCADGCEVEISYMLWIKVSWKHTQLKP